MKRSRKGDGAGVRLIEGPFPTDPVSTKNGIYRAVVESAVQYNCAIIVHLLSAPSKITAYDWLIGFSVFFSSELNQEISPFATQIFL